MAELRSIVKQLYKQLQYLGREYPGTNGPEKFRQQVRDAFQKHRNETDPKKIMEHISYGRYVAKEVETLYNFKK